MSEPAPAGWDDLARELDAWAASGAPAALWWRDDDAVAPSPALDRLLDIAARHDLPVALAVIPAGAVPALAERLAASTARVAVLQHGYAHENHAGPGEKKAELGPQRAAGTVLAALRAGRARLDALFAAAAIARPGVLVPPWNRIAPDVAQRLGEVGFTGLSTHAPRRAALAAPGVVQVNTHADIVDWHGGRGFVGEGRALGRVVAHLAARRTGAADRDEPTGILTHHLVHDEACWRFMADLAARLARHPGAVWLDAPAIFSTPGAGNLP